MRRFILALLLLPAISWGVEPEPSCGDELVLSFLATATRAEFDAYQRGEVTHLTSVEAMMERALADHPDSVLSRWSARRAIASALTPDERQIRSARLAVQAHAQMRETLGNATSGVRDYVVGLAENEIILTRMNHLVILSTVEQLDAYARSRFPAVVYAASSISRWLAAHMDPEMYRERKALMILQAAKRAARNRVNNGGSVGYSEDVRRWLCERMVLALEAYEAGTIERLPTMRELGIEAQAALRLSGAIGDSTVARISTELPPDVRDRWLAAQAEVIVAINLGHIAAKQGHPPAE